MTFVLPGNAQLILIVTGSKLISIAGRVLSHNMLNKAKCRPIRPFATCGAFCHLIELIPFERSTDSFLERAVSQLHMDQSIEMDWLAYALFQLAVAYVENGEFAQAQTTLNQIKSLPQNSRYAQFVQENEVAGSIISLCRNMVINADQILNTDIGNYLTQAAILVLATKQYQKNALFVI